MPDTTPPVTGEIEARRAETKRLHDLWMTHGGYFQMGRVHMFDATIEQFHSFCADLRSLNRVSGEKK